MTPTTNAPTEWRNRIVAHGEVPAVDLVPHPQNWRKHPKEQQGRLAASLGGVGWVQDVIVNQRTGRMLDGHLRAEMARQQGEATPVPVVYVDLSEDEERLVLASLDPIAGMAVMDEATLAALVRSIEDGDLRSVADDIAGALGVATGAGQAVVEDAGAEVDRAEELRQKWNVSAGQLWQLGEHRIICGDCTDAATVARVR
jgi:ribosomal protein L12E/L44/L45/RPP1/RPP2